LANAADGVLAVLYGGEGADVRQVAVPRSLFQKILSLIDDLRRRPVPA
jgi:hypothetical protein